MKATNLSLLFLLFTLPAYGQAFLPESHQLPLRSYVKQESGRQSVFWPDESTYIRASGFKLGQPATFVLRLPKTTPQTQIRYFYSLPDSLVREINIEIDSSNFLGRSYQAAQQYHEPLARQAVFEQYHQALVSEFAARWGAPGKDEKDIKTHDQVKYGERTTTWETPDLTADVYSIFTTQTTGGGTYRVRANIQYKNKSAPATVATHAPANPVQARISQQYAALVLKGQYQESWQMLGPEIRDALTYEQYVAQLQAFVDGLDKRHQDITLFMVGPMLTMTGATYYRYTYAIGKTPRSSPPARMLTVVFKDATAESIVGVQPRTLAGSTPIKLN
ncbi:MAG: hypothetical protein ACRYFX_17715 [Janthinobacterium lividum]